jgi:hypothetical protein
MDAKIGDSALQQSAMRAHGLLTQLSHHNSSAPHSSIHAGRRKSADLLAGLEGKSADRWANWDASKQSEPETEERPTGKPAEVRPEPLPRGVFASDRLVTVQEEKHEEKKETST